MKIVKAGDFVLYTSDKTAKEINDAVIEKLYHLLHNERMIKQIIEKLYHLLHNERMIKQIIEDVKNENQ